MARRIVREASQSGRETTVRTFLVLESTFLFKRCARVFARVETNPAIFVLRKCNPHVVQDAEANTEFVVAAEKQVKNIS